MKHIQTFNETLRNKMTPKSDYEIYIALNADPNITYKRTLNSNSGSYLLDEINISYDDLFGLFGDPETEDWVGNNFFWKVKSSDGHILSIYDNGTNLTQEELKNLPTYKWHIGGKNKEASNNLMGYIYRNIKLLND